MTIEPEPDDKPARLTFALVWFVIFLSLLLFWIGALKFIAHGN